MGTNYKQIQTQSGIVTITIDNNSGFCFGVVNAIEKAEQELLKGKGLNCYGHIVHNQVEVARLENLGLNTIDNSEFNNLANSTVLFRAHGEPPASYAKAKENNTTVIDATCPVVLKLQQRIRSTWELTKTNRTQIVIYGKKGHAEVVGLAGQTNNEALIIESQNDISQIDENRDVIMFSQTTKSIETYNELIEAVEKNSKASVIAHDTICRQMSNRAPKLIEFVQKQDLVFFVGGTQSSNAKYLFQVCKQANAQSYFISSENEISYEQIKPFKTIGICGATSTPMWLMEKVAEVIEGLLTGN